MADDINQVNSRFKKFHLPYALSSIYSFFHLTFFICDLLREVCVRLLASDGKRKRTNNLLKRYKNTLYLILQQRKVKRVE